LISLIWANIQRISKCWMDAREAHAAMTAIRDCQNQHGKLQRERDALLAVDHRAEETALAHEALSHIRTALQPYEKFLLEQKLCGGEPPNPFAPPMRNLNVKELEKQLAVFRALTVKKILAWMRGENN
jgi:hypothetical protein